MTTLDPEALRKRFHQADVQREALMAKMKPTWKVHKELIEQAQALEAKAKVLAEEMAPTRQKLFELENERGRIARFLAGSDGKSRMGKREEYLTPEEIAALSA
jgi:hypothetical protein